MALTGKYFYNQTEQLLTTSYQEFSFAQPVRSFVIINDAAAGGSSIEYSRDGTLKNGEVKPGDVAEIHGQGAPPRFIAKISLKSSDAAVPDYRMQAMEG